MLDGLFVAARCGWRLKFPIRSVLEPLRRAENSDQLLGFVVVRSKIFVRDGPVEPFSVPAIGLEIVRPHAQRNAAVVIGATAQHSGAPPLPIGAGRVYIGL